MKLLLVSDLHRDGKKLLWLLEEAPSHDALLVAGDHLNIFSNVSFSEQQAGAIRWSNVVRENKSFFAWCSGNHDFPNGDCTLMSSASPLWMQDKEYSGDFVGDGQSRILCGACGSFVITTIPWPITSGDLFIEGKMIPHIDFIKALLRQGDDLRKQEKAPWIVLIHEPPAPSPLAVGYSAPEAEFTRRIIELAQPDFSLHGHIHDAPMRQGGSWIWHIGRTICFNPGQSSLGEQPHFILLEYSSPTDWKATWQGSGSSQTTSNENPIPNTKNP
jgi:Icc-related predicted phosphoesterase